MELKEILLNEIQRKTHKQILTHNLRANELNCAVIGKDKSFFVEFICNDTNSKEWTFCYKDISYNFSSKLVCIFVNGLNDSDLEYHIIGIQELLQELSVSLKDFISDKDKKYVLNDNLDKYLNNWDIFN